MNRLLFILLSTIFISSCSRPNIPEALKISPLWEELDGLKLQFGQRISIQDDIEAIVIDVTKDEGGIWYGMCFLNDNKLFGRQIPNGILFPTCTDVLDLTYLKESSLQLVTAKEVLKISPSSIGVGSNWPATNMTDLMSSYNFGLDRRKLEQTPCTENIFGLNPVRECYFDLDLIKE